MQYEGLARFTNISKMILKKRYDRYNQGKFINKNLQEAMMNISRLLNRYRKEKKQKQLDPHIKDRNFLCETIKKNQKGVLQ